VHDCSEGGLAVALAEMAIQGETGFRVDLGNVAGDDIDVVAACFSESASRVVVAVEPARLAEVTRRAGEGGVPVMEIGGSGGDRLIAEGAFDLSLADATHAWRDAIPNALGVATSS
jgi:phosphoribosylformylglycinamidine synthase